MVKLCPSHIADAKRVPNRTNVLYAVVATTASCFAPPDDHLSTYPAHTLSLADYIVDKKPPPTR